MKKMCKVVLCALSIISFCSFTAFAGEMSNDEPINKPDTMKSKVEKPESSHDEKDDEMKDLRQGLVKLRKEKEVDIKMEEEPGGIRLTDNLTLSGIIEVEAAHESVDAEDPAVPVYHSSDITLATVEVGINADITKHVSGHVLLLWEEDDTEPVDIDEGIISISGEDVVPLYLDAGKMYVPFGFYPSHFISEPLTLELGEIRESAVRFGFSNYMFDVSLSLFNTGVDEINGDDESDSMVASAVFLLPEGIVPELMLSLGASYITNIADSDGLEDEVPAGSVNEYVPGMGFFLSASLMEKIFMELEYVGATDSFTPGELSFDGGMAYKPTTHNFELALAYNDRLELGFKYEGGKDLGNFLPEKQYGCVLNYRIFRNTNIGVEYLHGKYENGDERDLFTAQLAIEF